MRILVDDRECPISAATIAEAINVAAETAGRDGRNVVDVFVDGEAWTDVELNNPDLLARVADEVRCVTASPAALLRETFLHAAQALVEAEKLLRDAARLIQADDVKAGMTTLAEGLSVWISIQKATASGTAFGGIDPGAITSPEGSLNDAVADLNRLLVALKTAIETSDTVAASDCLLYEFPPVTRRWTAILAELARRADTVGVR